jgi:hypothetical protein
MSRPRDGHTRLWPLAFALASLGAALSGCGATPTVVVHFSGGPDDALVHIDDQYIGLLGRLEKRGIALPVGTHRVTVEQVGYFPHDVLIEVVEERPPPPVVVHLALIPD